MQQLLCLTVTFNSDYEMTILVSQQGTRAMRYLFTTQYILALHPSSGTTLIS